MQSLRILAAAAVALGVTLTGAGAKDWKTVVIGMEGAYEPYNLTDPNGKIIGFEPDVAMDACARMKVECKIIAQDWDGMIPGLNAGKFDVIMDGMSITEERKKQIDFSIPYSAVPAAFAAAKSSPLAKLPHDGKVVNFDKDKAAGDAALKRAARGAEGQDARRPGLHHPRHVRHQPFQGRRRRSRNTRPPTTATST